MCHAPTTAERSSPAYSSTFQKRNEIASGKETKVRGLIHYSNLRLIARLSHRVDSESMRQNLIVQHQNCATAAFVLPTRGDKVCILNGGLFDLYKSPTHYPIPTGKC